MKYKKIRIFNGKKYSLHGEYGTMIDVSNVKEELERQGYSVRTTSRGACSPGANVYKRLKSCGLLEALKEIAKGEGRYNMDKLIHASNTIEDMKLIAKEAIEKAL